MKNKKKFIILILQIVLIIAFVFMYKQYVDFSLQPTKVYGYKTALSEGVKITERDLGSIPLSQMTLTSDMITVDKKNEVLGKYLTVPVVSKSIVYKSQLGDITSVDKFASLDMSNLRVVSLPITYEVGVAGDFRRGDRLDLMYSQAGASAEVSASSAEGGGQAKSGALDEGGGNNSSFAYAKIFMPNIPIYQVNTASGHMFVPHSNVNMYEVKLNDKGEPIDSSSYEAIATISLIVTPEQAEEIQARKETGTITFVKRFEESETHETLGFVIGKYGKIFAGNANAETGNIQISDAFVSSNNTTINSTENPLPEDVANGASGSSPSIGTTLTDIDNPNKK